MYISEGDRRRRRDAERDRERDRGRKRERAAGPFLAFATELPNARWSRESVKVNGRRLGPETSARTCGKRRRRGPGQSGERASEQAGVFRGPCGVHGVPRHEGAFFLRFLRGHRINGPSAASRAVRAPSRKSMFRKSMGSGDNGTPHKRAGQDMGTSVRKEVAYASPSHDRFFPHAR